MRITRRNCIFQILKHETGNHARTNTHTHSPTHPVPHKEGSCGGGGGGGGERRESIIPQVGRASPGHKYSRMTHPSLRPHNNISGNSAEEWERETECSRTGEVEFTTSFNDAVAHSEELVGCHVPEWH